MQINKPLFISISTNPFLTTQADIEMFRQLLALTKAQCYRYSRTLQEDAKYKAHLQWITDKTPLLAGKEYELRTKLHWVFMGIQEFPKCSTCGKPFIGKNVKLTVGYPKFCSMKCLSNDNNVLLKRKQACEAKYGIGIINPSQAECVKRQKAETSFKHYGVFNPNHARVVRQKIEQTNLRIRGAKCPFAAEAVKAKIAETNIKRIGVANPFELPSAAYKGLQVRLKKYGNACGKMRIYNFNGIIFDSSWELAVWIYHVDHNISIERLPIQLQYEKDNSTHIYLPDFKIAGRLVEVKGDHMFDKQGNPVFDGKHPWIEKYQCMLENSVEIWRFNDVKPFIDYVRQKYGAGYLKSFRVEKPSGVDKAK